MRKNISNTRETPEKERLFCHLLFALLFLTLCPGTCFADGKRIFDEHKNSVVSVFAYDREGRQLDQASGFIVSKDGAVATSYRIVSIASTIRIKREDTMFEVKGLLLGDRDSDIAILKINDKDLPALTLRDAGPTPEGQKIYLIGSPRGEDKILLEGSLIRTKDLASGRKLLVMTPPVPKGLSGGPVFNDQGEVIGIAAFFLEEAQPYYFAMPVAGLQERLSKGKFVPLQKAELKAYNETAEYWFTLGAVYDSLTLYSSASGAYQESLRLRPEDATTHNALGLAYTNLGIYSFAIREHQEAIRLAPDLQTAYFNLGIAYAKSGNNPKALETFEKAITLKPDDPDSYNNLAFACFKAGRYREAVEAARKAIGLRPDYPEAYYNLGVSYFRMNMTGDAVEALKESIRLNPNIPEAHFGLGVIYRIQDLPAALKEYEILKNLDPSGAKALEDIIKESGTGTFGTLDQSAVSGKDKARTVPVEIARGEVLPAVPSTPESGAAAKEGLSPAETGPPGTAPAQVALPKGSHTINREVYSVQVAVLREKHGALTLTGSLQKKHYDAFIKIEKKAGQDTRYRVLVGRFPGKNEAEKTARELLKKEKMESIIFRH